MKRTRLIAFVFAAVIGTACGGGGSRAPGATETGIRIASFDFAESRLIAELYAQALEDDGFDVVRMGAVGPREVVAPALEQGLLDVVPEYVGSAAEYFGATIADVAGLAAAVEPRGLTALEPAPAENVNVIVVIHLTARRHGLVTISDLADLGASFTLGGPVECPDRPHCLVGLESVYGLHFAEFVPSRSLAITAEALIRREIDVGVMFSTAAELTSSQFVVLDDDRHLQPAENIVPLVRQATIDRWGPRLTDTLDSLSRLLTTDELQAMNRRVRDGDLPGAVAASWLRSTGLIDT